MRFTERSANVLVRAKSAATAVGQSYIGTEHILVGILEEGEGLAYETLAGQGVDAEKVRTAIGPAKPVEESEESASEEGGEGEIDINAVLSRFTPRTKRLVEIAAYEARKSGVDYIEPEHLLLGLLREGESVALRILSGLGVDIRKAYSQAGSTRPKSEDSEDDAEPAEEEPGSTESSDSSIDEINRNLARMKDGEDGHPGAPDGKRPGKPPTDTPNLDKFSRDLTQMAREGRFDPIIGREAEIERLMQILCRRTKNNPCLIGEPGVGKTAIVEGLAQKIAADDVPEPIKGRRIVSVVLAGMVAGSKYRGEFEERLKKGLNEAIKSGRTILFIDELHTLIGAGNAEGAMDAANILKPLLTRGELQIIGATTLDEYRKHIEKDAALERRFQPVQVGEPSPEEAVLILKGIRDKYEAHHSVRITDEAVEAAVRLSSRYIMDRFLPDKAIDLIDEAASRLRMKSFMAPDTIKEAEEKLAAVVREKKSAADREDFESASRLKDEESRLQEELRVARDEWQKKVDSRSNALTEDDIAAIVAAWTGIPMRKLTEDESERLRNLEQELHKRVIGQDEAVHAVAKAIRRGRLGLKDPRRPNGSFIFLGTTGVGKTELARALADVMFGDEKALIRLDMSEYMEKFDVSKLIGSPPGYVGYEEGGQLTEKVRRRPYSVVLFDEIEKAHPDVFNTLLQILEDGRLTDSQGRAVDFRNTVVIMTSNIGARLLTTSAGRRIGFSPANGEAGAKPADERLYGGKTFEEARALVMEEVKRTFNPEFINRVDEIIFFQMLDLSAMKQIVDLMVGALAKRISASGLSIELTDAAREFLAEHGFDPHYGARPLRRSIQSLVEDRLSEEMLEGRLKAGDTAFVDSDGKSILICRKGEEAKPEAASTATAEPAAPEAGKPK